MPIEIEIVDSSLPRICLNMIVKNESRIIRRLLESVAPVIDAYCICDTGSTDNTVEIIEEFFKGKGIPGKIPREPFLNFAHNRSFSLKQCESLDIDYILLLDADMIFKLGAGVTAEDFKRGLTQDAYHMFQGTEAFYYKNARIVKNRIGASYWGVTHEYLKTPEGSSYGVIETTQAFINDVGDGGSKSDKFERDIRLLLKGLEENPNNDRYTFYLANSYRDNGNQDAAIKYYKKRIEIGGWYEEIWHSYYSIGKCYKAKGDMVNAIHWWMEAYQFFPNRIENLYEIITHYRQIGKNQIAYMFYVMALKQMLLNPSKDYLFLQQDVYDYKLDYEFSIIGYYCNVDNYDMTRICTKVLNFKMTDQNVARNVMSNYKFYAKKLADLKTEFPKDALVALQDIGKDLVAGEPDADFFVNSTPSIAVVGDELVVNVRYVNYRIDDRGGYVNHDNISTKNVVAKFDLATWEKKSEDFLWYDENQDNLYVGLEDVRIFYSESRGKLLYNANRGLGASSIVVEHSEVLTRAERSASTFNSRTTIKPGALFMEGQTSIEKNWVLFEDANGNIKVIYNWHNLVIGDIVQDKDELDSDGNSIGYIFEKTHEIQTPPIFKCFRGSTNGVLIGDEIWFICHVVSYEDRRYYYHVIFALDATTYAVKRFTPLFTFEGEKVEYTLGFVYRPIEDVFWIGYSKMDRSTNYMAIKKSAIEGLM